MENEKSNEFDNNQDLGSITEFQDGYNNRISYTDNNMINNLKRKSRQLSSKSMTTTIKYICTISKNDTIRENKFKKDNDLINKSLMNGTILRTQSRILNNKNNEDYLMLKSEYSYRNKGFENFDMDKVFGSSYHKNKKIISKKSSQKFDNNNNNEKIKIFKKYSLNYNKDNSEENNKETINRENKERINQNIENNNSNKLKLLKNDYYNDINKTNKYMDLNSKIKKNKDEINKTNETKLITDEISKIKSQPKLPNENIKKNSIKQKQSLPFNIKQQIINMEGNMFIPKTKNNLFIYNNYQKRNKLENENNKTVDKIGFNKKDYFFNKVFNENNSFMSNINKNSNVNMINLYNKCANKITNCKQFYNNRTTIGLINNYGNFRKEKCIMPPNNLKNILSKRENDFFWY